MKRLSPGLSAVFIVLLMQQTAWSVELGPVVRGRCGVYTDQLAFTVSVHRRGWHWLCCQPVKVRCAGGQHQDASAAEEQAQVR